MKYSRRPFILRLLDAIFPSDPTIPPRRRPTIETHVKKAERRHIRERKPKEPKP